jgi:hypothetical protein
MASKCKLERRQNARWIAAASVASSNVILGEPLADAPKTSKRALRLASVNYESQLMRTADVSLQLGPARACCDQA